MNINLNKKQLIEIYKAGYIPEDRLSLRGVVIDQFYDPKTCSLRQPAYGAWLISVRIETYRGKRRVYIDDIDPQLFNLYAAIKKIEELLGWKD